MNSFDDASKSKKPKGKPNAFLKFMLQMKKNEEKSGNFMSMAEAQEEAGKKWASMEKEDKSSFEFSAVESPCMKYTSIGIAFDEMDRQKIQARKDQQTMELTIAEMIASAAEKKELKSLEFIFVSTSFFVTTLDGDIFPAEIAMSKFSLLEGVKETFNILINPGELPLGMASTAKIISEKYHRLPIPPQQKLDAEKDYHFIFNKVMEFLIGVGGKVNNIPPVFVESGSKNVDLEAVKMTLNKIVAEGSDSFNIEFRVYPLEHLLHRLHKKSVEDRCANYHTTDKPFSSVHMAKEMLNRDEFMYSDIGCEFHSEIDNSAHCCLSKVKRWGFRFSQLCLDADRDKLIAGMHIPLKLIMFNNSEASSTSSKDDDWESEFVSSFCTMEIDSVTSKPKASDTIEGSTNADSEINDTASIYSTEMTCKVAPSTTDESLPFKKVGYEKMKFRHMLMRGRSGKTSATSSGSKP